MIVLSFAVGARMLMDQFVVSAPPERKVRRV
jgi:hypothetical protein